MKGSKKLYHRSNMSNTRNCLRIGVSTTANEDIRETSSKLLHVRSFTLVMILSIILGCWDCRAQSPAALECVQVKTFRLDSGWGYQILIHNQVFYKQTTSPVTYGIRPFQQEADALTFGLLVKYRILHGSSVGNDHHRLKESQIPITKYHRELFFK